MFMISQTPALLSRSSMIAPPSAKSLCADVGWHKVAVAEPTRAAQEVSQAVGYTCSRVASTLLQCCIAWKEKQKIH